MKNKDIISEWLKRARSNLERARAKKTTDEILYEDLCFDARIMSLFNFFWSVEKHDTNPANTGTIGLLQSVKSVLICG